MRGFLLALLCQRLYTALAMTPAMEYVTTQNKASIICAV